MEQIGLRLATLFIPSDPPSLPPAPLRSHHQRRDRHFGGDEGRKRRVVRPSVRPCDRGPPRRRSGRASVRPSVCPPLFSAGGIKSEHPRTQRTLHHDKTIGLCRCNDAGLLHRPPPSVKEATERRFLHLHPSTRDGDVPSQSLIRCSALDAHVWWVNGAVKAGACRSPSLPPSGCHAISPSLPPSLPIPHHAVDGRRILPRLYRR